MNPKKLSIIMAVYNEKASLLEVLNRIEQENIGLEKEIVIVDGCSTDGTRQILEQINKPDVKIIFEQKRNGKGTALREGFNKATGEIMLIQDADLELSPSDYSQLLRPILENKSRVVYGSRFLRGRGRVSWLNYLGNKIVTMTANLLFKSRLTDIATCYKVFRPEVIKDMRFLCRGFEFDVELTASILKKGERILEVPIAYWPRTKKEGKKVHWLAGIPCLLTIIRCRLP